MFGNIKILMYVMSHLVSNVLKCLAAKKKKKKKKTD